MQNFFFPTNLRFGTVEQEDGFTRTMQQNFAALSAADFRQRNVEIQKCNRLLFETKGLFGMSLSSHEGSGN